MYSKVLEMWRSYGCPYGYTGGFYVLHLAISIIGSVVGFVCCVLFSIHDNRDPGYAVWAAISSLLAAALSIMHFAVRYIPGHAPPERLNQFAIVGGVGALAGLLGVIVYMGRALFMTSLIRSQVVLAVWAIITLTWGGALTAFARYYQGQTEECRPIMQQSQLETNLQQNNQQQQQHQLQLDELRMGNVV